MSRKQLKTINPNDYSYAFRLSKFDCYKLRTGICSLDLSEEEFNEILKREGKRAFSDGSVEYCREFSKYIVENSIHTIESGIMMHQHSCEHVSFSDGQHRTCISRRMNISNLVCNFTDDRSYNLVCRPCYFEQLKISSYNQPKNLWQKLLRNKNSRANENTNIGEFIADKSFFNS